MPSLSKTILPEDKPQIITTRMLAAPRELVWKVLTTPEHFKQYWGPDGFRNTIKEMNVKVGGQILFTMHGPDGKDTALDATIFSYKCECGLAFSFEIKHGLKPVSKSTGLRERRNSPR